MRTRPLIIAGSALVSLFSVLYAQTEQPQSPIDKTPALARVSQDKPQLNETVRIKTFYLKDGSLVMGRVIFEDKNQITLEELNQSPIVVSMYAKRQIASGTMHTQVMSELDYCRKFAAHFASKAWDFRDDPDDFIQSIRLYEKAKQLLSQAANPDPQEISEIDQKIAQVKADRQIWITEAESRAELSKLQTRAVIDQRMDELKQEITKNTAELAAIRQTLDGRYKTLEQRISDLDMTLEDLYRRLEQLTDDLKVIREDIRELRRDYRRRYPRVYIRPR